MNKTKSVRVRLTEREWEAADSVSLGLFGTPNKSRLIRKLLRNYVGMSPDLSDEELNILRESVRQLTGISRNLNQITARINSGEPPVNLLNKEYIEDIKKYVTVVNNDIKKLINGSVNRFQDIVNHE